jgi:REP-associated tyrosine transposase
LHKVRFYIKPWCDILNYTLMPNHFHFTIYSDIRTIATKKKGNQVRNVLSEGFRNLLSSYSQAINKQNKTTGSLFQQNTKSKYLDESINYASIAFHYVHQNALNAGLVSKMEEWEYSSFRDYIGFRNGTLCNKKLAFELLDLNEETFYKDSYAVIDKGLIKKIY